MEREWLDFGHKFGERCGHQPGHDDINERCPAFVQWLDAVQQLMRQYPTDFEFNETFLVSSRHICFILNINLTFLNCKM